MCITETPHPQLRTSSDDDDNSIPSVHTVYHISSSTFIGAYLLINFSFCAIVEAAAAAAVASEAQFPLHSSRAQKFHPLRRRHGTRTTRRWVPRVIDGNLGVVVVVLRVFCTSSAASNSRNLARRPEGSQARGNLLHSTDIYFFAILNPQHSGKLIKWATMKIFPPIDRVSLQKIKFTILL